MLLVAPPGEGPQMVIWRLRSFKSTGSSLRARCPVCVLSGDRDVAFLCFTVPQLRVYLKHQWRFRSWHDPRSCAPSLLTSGRLYTPCQSQFPVRNAPLDNNNTPKVALYSPFRPYVARGVWSELAALDIAVTATSHEAGMTPFRNPLRQCLLGGTWKTLGLRHISTYLLFNKRH
jgi:hypothetical protein